MGGWMGNLVEEVEEVGSEVALAVKDEVVAIEQDLVAVERKVESVAGNTLNKIINLSMISNLQRKKI